MKHGDRSVLHSPYFRHCCYMCMEKGDYSEKRSLHKHHVFMGPLRRTSEAEGLFVWLCPDCHMLGEHAVHKDYVVCRKLQAEAQRRYEAEHSREEFMRLFGRSFL